MCKILQDVVHSRIDVQGRGFDKNKNVAEEQLEINKAMRFIVLYIHCMDFV